MVGGSVVGGFDKTREMHTELFLNQHTFMMNWSDEDLFVYGNYDSILIISIFNQHADATFTACLTLHLPQAPEYFWRYCASFLLEVWKTERSFSFINRIQHRLRNSISTNLLWAFAVITRHGHSILILKTNIWTPTLKGGWRFSLFIDGLLIRYLY